jgi:hypothetical protein
MLMLLLTIETEVWLIYYDSLGGGTIVSYHHVFALKLIIFYELLNALELI